MSEAAIITLIIVAGIVAIFVTLAVLAVVASRAQGKRITDRKNDTNKLGEK